MSHKVSKPESISHPLQRPCEDQDCDRRDHQFKSVCQAVHKAFECNDFSRKIEDKHKEHRYKCGKDQAGLCVTAGKCGDDVRRPAFRSEEHTSELQSRFDLVCRLLLEKKNETSTITITTII